MRVDVSIYTCRQCCFSFPINFSFDHHHHCHGTRQCETVAVRRQGVCFTFTLEHVVSLLRSPCHCFHFRRRFHRSGFALNRLVILVALSHYVASSSSSSRVDLNLFSLSNQRYFPHWISPREEPVSSLVSPMQWSVLPESHVSCVLETTELPAHISLQYWLRSINGTQVTAMIGWLLFISLCFAYICDNTNEFSSLSVLPSFSSRFFVKASFAKKREEKEGRTDRQRREFVGVIAYICKAKRNE